MPEQNLHDNLKSLGEGITSYDFDRISPELLECFPSPIDNSSWDLISSNNYSGFIKIEAPEVTSLCPKTGQPDFVNVKIEYIPDKWCVESKSLKLYLGSFRQVGIFHEAFVQRVLNDLVALLKPYTLRVTGEFTPRGGIKFWPSCEYTRSKSLQE